MNEKYAVLVNVDGVIVLHSLYSSEETALIEMIRIQDETKDKPMLYVFQTDLKKIKGE